MGIGVQVSCFRGTLLEKPVRVKGKRVRKGKEVN
jgi:hypothetical protein